MALHELLQSLDEQLLDPQLRRKPERVAALLAEDFREFGSSGRVFDKTQIMQELLQETGYTRPTIANFEMDLLAPGVALVTYQAIRETGAASSLRSSIWILRGDVWQVLFHQGTHMLLESRSIKGDDRSDGIG